MRLASTSRPVGAPEPLAERTAARDGARALTGIGAAVLVYSAVNALVPPAAPPWVIGVNCAIGVAMAATGWWLARNEWPAQKVAWAFVGEVAALTIWLLVVFCLDPVVSNLLYVAVAMTAFGPLAASWRPFFAASIVMLTAAYAALAYVQPPDASSWVIGLSSATVVSAILVRLRIRSLDDIRSAEEALRLNSSHDALTGILNRQGLQEYLPGLWADAIRRSEPVTVTFMDLRGLKQANDGHGHDVGDDAIVGAALAISDTVRINDLVARWGGDEFVVVSLGDETSGETFARRLNLRFAEVSAARRDGWIGEISVGRASAQPQDSDFPTLLHGADADMYAHRAEPPRTPTVQN